MKVELIKTPDSDAKVVDSARVSFDKTHNLYTDEANAKLINYLAKHRHFTPFTHCRHTFKTEIDLQSCGPEDVAGVVWDEKHVKASLFGWANLLAKNLVDDNGISGFLHQEYPVSAKALGIPRQPARDPVLVDNEYFIDYTVRETIPIFVARQRFKHVVGFTYNEVSRRYVDSDPEFFEPASWRERPPASLKQGSGCAMDSEMFDYIHLDNTRHANAAYKTMLEHGVCPEQARMELPQSMYTSYYVTGSLAAFRRAYQLRSKDNAQVEIQNLAKLWKEVIPL